MARRKPAKAAWPMDTFADACRFVLPGQEPPEPVQRTLGFQPQPMPAFLRGPAIAGKQEGARWMG